MFHYDLTAEDGRIVCTEHRIKLEGEELKDAMRNHALYNQDRKNEHKSELPFIDTKHDGTFDVKHIDGLTGATKTVNLTNEQLASVIYIAMVGDEGLLSKVLYNTDEIKKYQELMKDCRFLSFIP